MATSAIPLPAAVIPNQINYVTSSGSVAIPSGCQKIKVTVIGGGGGAGSGRKGAAGTIRGAAGGPNGGTMTRVTVDRSSIADASLNVTIGAGGAGGAAQTANSTNGNAGTAGGTTIVDGTIHGIIARAVGGRASGGGTAGVAYSNIPLAVTSNIPVGGPYGISDGQGGYGFYAGTTSNSGAAFSNGLDGRVACPGGSGGTGWSAADVAGSDAGRTGGGAYNNGVLVPGPASGNGADNVGLVLDDDGVVHTHGVGTSGAGGSAATWGEAGNGGLYGAAGAGGYGGTDGVHDSGKGGDGAQGLAIITFIF